MRIWQWFCNIGMPKTLPLYLYRKGLPAPMPHDRFSEQGVDICTRLCGHSGCQCGSTQRGLHCIWSHYRLEK